jgi:hypothetical protein
MNNYIFAFIVKGPLRNKIIKALIFYSNEILIYKQTEKYRLLERSIYCNKNLKNNVIEYLKNTKNCYPKLIIIKLNPLLIGYLSLTQSDKKQWESAIIELFNNRYIVKNHNRKSLRNCLLNVNESFFKSPKKYLTDFANILIKDKQYVLEKHIIK